MIRATTLLNNNNFPDTAKYAAGMAANRLAVMLHNIDLLNSSIDNAAEDFYVHLKRNWQGYVRACKQKPDIEFIAYSDGLEYISSMHSILYEFKAFLDLYAQLVCRLIKPTGSTKGFSRATIKGVSLSGGGFANWIDSSCSVNDVPNQSELTKQIIHASSEWITDVVDLRDIIVHRRDLPDLRHMRVSISHGPTEISISDILQPEMQDGQALYKYAQLLADKLCKFVGNTISLLPNVKKH